MKIISRRQFGASVAGVPLAALVASRGVSASAAVVGVTTASFRELPRETGRDNLEDIIRAVQGVRVSHVELALANIEPAPPSTAPFMGGSPAYPQRVVLTPEQITQTNAWARKELRTWRLHTEAAHFDAVRRRLADAKIAVVACAVAFDDSFTNEEIDATFQQVKALGVTTISSPMTPAIARRLVPFAARHKVSVAIHNQLDGNRAGLIDTPWLEDALRLSPAFSIKLDVGNLTASNCDAVAELRARRGRVAYVVIKDRLRNGGASQMFGEGDTPIKSVMNVLRETSPSIPALIEYDYVGLRPATDEVRASLGYVAQGAQ